MKNRFIRFWLTALLIFAIALIPLFSGALSGTQPSNTSATTQEAVQDGGNLMARKTRRPSRTPTRAPTATPAAAPQGEEGRAAGETLEDYFRRIVREDGQYSDREHVAAYLVTYGHLPGNYLTKSEAQRLGWDSSRGNLWQVAPGKSIGGDRFGNYERLLPYGSYKECDIDYTGGYRGSRRIIYEAKGAVYYTEDHYNTFIRLYPEDDTDALSNY